MVKIGIGIIGFMMFYISSANAQGRLGVRGETCPGPFWIGTMDCADRLEMIRWWNSMGNGMRNAGAAMQNIGPSPSQPRNITCNRMGNFVNCQEW